MLVEIRERQSMLTKLSILKSPWTIVNSPFEQCFSYQGSSQSIAGIWPTTFPLSSPSPFTAA